MVPTQVTKGLEKTFTTIKNKGTFVTEVQVESKGISVLRGGIKLKHKMFLRNMNSVDAKFLSCCVCGTVSPG